MPVGVHAFKEFFRIIPFLQMPLDLQECTPPVSAALGGAEVEVPFYFHCIYLFLF